VQVIRCKRRIISACCQVANLALLIAHTPSSAVVLFRAATSLGAFYTACKEIRWLHFAPRAVWIIIKLPHIRCCSRSLSWWITLINYTADRQQLGCSERWACTRAPWERAFRHCTMAGGRPVGTARCDTLHSIIYDLLRTATSFLPVPAQKASAQFAWTETLSAFVSRQWGTLIRENCFFERRLIFVNNVKGTE
jgi:hypothetical protein